MVAADMTMQFILQPERAARLVTQKALDPTLPGLDDVLDRLAIAVFEAATANAYEHEIRRAVERILTSHLMRLAESAPMSQVRSLAMARLRQMTEAGFVVADDDAHRAHRQLLAGDVTRFLERPYDNMRSGTTPAAPPGAPIGDYGLDYLLGIDICAWNEGS